MNPQKILQGLAAVRLGRESAISDRVAEITKGLGPDYDYSVVGSRTSGEHLGDLGKLPNHPTFSDQSVYHNNTAQGGTWGTTVDGRDTYTPSAQMVQQGKTEGLAGYMTSREPNTVLMMPAPYRLQDKGK